MDIKRMFALIVSLLMLTGCSDTTISSPEDTAEATAMSDSDLPYYGTTARTRATLP